MVTERGRTLFPEFVLLAWFVSFSFLFVIMPEWARWAYILLFPFLIVNELFRRWQTEQRKIRVNPIDLAPIVYIVLVIFSIVTTTALPLPDMLYTHEFLYNVVTPVMLFAYVRLVGLNRPGTPLFGLILAALVVFQAVMGFVSLQAPLQLPEAYQPRPIHQYSRATGTYVAPEGYVLTLLFAMTFVFWRSLESGSERERRLWLGSLAVAAFGVLISGNRTGWFNLGLLTLVMMILDRRLIKWIISLGIVGMIGLLTITPDFIDRSLQRLQEWRPIESRIITHTAGIRMAAEQPVLGWGYATYDLYDWEFMQPIGQIEATRYELSIATSHNTYLTILAEMGLVGFFLYMLPTGYYLLRTLAEWSNLQYRRYLALLWTLIIIVQIAGQLADLRFFPFALGYWWFALALIANDLDVQSRRRADV